MYHKEEDMGANIGLPSFFLSLFLAVLGLKCRGWLFIAVHGLLSSCDVQATLELWQSAILLLCQGFHASFSVHGALDFW